ncbi:MAG: hypothetical protein F4Y08_11445 [Caldilineaceae bacterium SB0662_bin_9]|uniref:Bacterial Ig-like domain-containing protein n=1 Tax=Caldilineaceae bacterium SB0662_bin_9 TaxID=2605258 RepID=A0A6B1DUL7_9CHLR|nr:hypothetical protein [Caldilineaceae bacterium SB0662_bin_9]
MKNIGACALKSIPLVLLALITAGGASFAGGDLFDDDYFDCPARTRLRHGQIADLTVSRDSDDADEVNVSWTSTDPASWGLGSNTFNTFLVLLLDDEDGDPLSQSLSLGLNKTTFDGVKTAAEVTVEMAIVVGTSHGDYLISDILRQDINQSLGTPSFSGEWYQLLQTPATDDSAYETPDADDDTPGHQYTFEEVGGGSMYYIGYNENFANYRKGTANYVHNPATPRLRIGLVHSADDDEQGRDNVDFESYIIRIVDSDGDVVTEGDDVPTNTSDYGFGINSNVDTTRQTLNKLWIHDLSDTSYPTLSSSGTIIRNRDGSALAYSTNFAFNPSTHLDTGEIFSNVRVKDGSQITPAMHQLPATVVTRMTDNEVAPPSISMMKVDTTGNGNQTLYRDAGQVFAHPPDEYRDFAVDTLTTDETHTITAWAVNEDGEVISPVATVKVHPTDNTVTLTATAGFRDYKNQTAIGAGTLVVTTFTVIK